MEVRVHNEIGLLRQVLVHRPGAEILRMTREQMEALLFDDILSLEVAQREHSVMQEILAAFGARVVEMRELLAQGLRSAPDGARVDLVTAVARQGGEPGLADALHDLPPHRLADVLIAGLGWDEVDGLPQTLSRLAGALRGDPPVALPPVPNLMFMRDPCISVYDRVVVGRMATSARAREPMLVRFALRWGLPDGVPMLFDDQADGSLEGGDVLVISDEVLVVGCSERTAPHTLERLAREALFPAFPALQRVYAVLMPRRRSVMHLDTVLTQIDRGLFLGHVPMVVGRNGVSPLDVAVIERDTPARAHQGGVLDALRDELGEAELVPCGGDDPLHQDREQWTDGANAVCLAPGHIVLYSRNVVTTRVLCERFGFQEVAISADAPVYERRAALGESLARDRVVYTFTGSELSRARGGGRCMTMPLARDAVRDG